MTYPNAPYVGDPEAAVSFLTELNGGTCPALEVDTDLIARLDGDVMLWREAFTDDPDPEQGATIPDGVGDLTTMGLLAWAEDAVAYRLGLTGPDLPEHAATEAVALAGAVQDALMEVERWAFLVAAAAVAGIAADPPCGCAFALDPEHGDLHTQREHRRGSCGGPRVPAPCGGCYDCLAAQVAYYATLEGDR